MAFVTVHILIQKLDKHGEMVIATGTIPFTSLWGVVKSLFHLLYLLCFHVMLMQCLLQRHVLILLSSAAPFPIYLSLATLRFWLVAHLEISSVLSIMKLTTHC